MTHSYFPKWPCKRSGTIAPDERLPWTSTVVMGIQHIVAMFGATLLAPILMGFDPNVAILMSGIGTLIFFVVVGGRVPSYLGSSFAFIGPVIAVTGYQGIGHNPKLAIAAGGIVVCGFIYFLIGLLVAKLGTKWIESLMPPVVTGAVVAVIGLNLAPIAVKGASASTFDTWIALMTVLCVAGIAVYGRGVVRRLPILLGLVVATGIHMLLTNGLGLSTPMNFEPLIQAPWFGLPRFVAPEFHGPSILPIALVVVILVAENLGHLKAVGAMTGRSMDRYMGRAFMGDGLATMLAGGVGGIGVTTYAENIGVMAVTRIYSTLMFVVAGFFAILLGFSPKFGALIQAVPGAVLSGISLVVFGLIAVSGAKIWVDRKVDFSDQRNLLVAAVTLAFGAGDFSVHFDSFSLGGIGTATFAAIILNWLLSGTRPSKN